MHTPQSDPALGAAGFQGHLDLAPTCHPVPHVGGPPSFGDALWVTQLSIDQPRAATALPFVHTNGRHWTPHRQCDLRSIDSRLPCLTHILTKQVPKLPTTRGSMMRAFSALAAPLLLLAAAGLMGTAHGQEIVAQAPLDVNLAVVGAAGYAKGYAYFW